MSCERHLLLRYSRGELGPQTARRLAIHLDECTVCSQRLLVMVALAESQRLVDRARKRHRWMWAAALLLLMTSTPALYRSLVSPAVSSGPSSLAETDAYPLIPLRNRSESDPETRQGYRAYLRGDYARAESLLRESGTERDLLLRGVSLYMLGREREAATLLQRIPPESAWQEPARWYEANARLRLGEYPAARDLLRQLAAREGDYSEQAAELSRGLEELP